MQGTGAQRIRHHDPNVILGQSLHSFGWAALFARYDSDGHCGCCGCAISESDRVMQICGSKHTHKPIKGSRRGGVAMADCGLEHCDLTHTHIQVICRCGATGVQCLRGVERTGKNRERDRPENRFVLPGRLGGPLCPEVWSRYFPVETITCGALAHGATGTAKNRASGNLRKK